MSKETVALIYARVSSERQKKEGNGLDSQEQRCRVYAVAKNYGVEKVFKDSFTGGGDFMQRPAMRELIEHVDTHPHKNYVVIFDDLKRFARDTVNHIKLRRSLDKRGVKVECPNFSFEDTPEGEFIETILAAQGQLEREQNKRQVVQKQKARLEAGYWTFNSQVPGYKRNNDPVHRWLLVRDEPKASIIEEALRGFASGRFYTQTDVKEFLESKGFFHKKQSENVYLEQVHRLLTRVLYAGFIEYPKWEVARRRGHHEAIIDLETFERIQERLRKGFIAKPRLDDNPAFPLRGFLKCSECHTLLTASYSKGRTKRYGYYRCKNKECRIYGKSISMSLVERDFDKLLKSFKPKKSVVQLTKEIATNIWQTSMNAMRSEREVKNKKIKEIEDEIDSYADLIPTARSPTIQKVYEKKIEKLSKEIEELQNSVALFVPENFDFGTALEEVFGYVESPYNIWTSGALDDKKLVLRLAFAEHLSVDPENGFGTAKPSIAYELFEQFGSTNSYDVKMKFLPGTSRCGHHTL